jgi:hypothetical protein
MLLMLEDNAERAQRFATTLRRIDPDIPLMVWRRDPASSAMDRARMIPTRHKAKLPRYLSYPIGAQALTEALASAPRAEAFTVSFWGKPVWPDSRFRRDLAEQHPYTILVAEYRPREKPGYGGCRSLAEKGWYDEKWQLTVYPVVRELRHLANRLLLDRGLPLVVEWLRSSQRAGWVSRTQRIELVFHPAAELVSANEVTGA